MEANGATVNQDRRAGGLPDFGPSVFGGSNPQRTFTLKRREEAAAAAPSASLPAPTPQAAMRPAPVAASPPADLAQPNYAMGAVGAGIGAGLGALIWWGIAYLTCMEFGYIAVAVGALAGWGTSWLTKYRDEVTGCIAAVAGVVGIFVGSYAAYYNNPIREMEMAGFRQDYREQMATEDPSWAGLSEAEKERRTARAYEAAVDAYNPGYWANLTADPMGFAITLLFGGLGLFYGFKVGRGDRVLGSPAFD